MKKFLCYAIGAVSSLCLLSCQKDDMKANTSWKCISRRCNETIKFKYY